MKRIFLLLLIGGCTTEQAIEEQAGQPSSTVPATTVDPTQVPEPWHDQPTPEETQNNVLLPNPLAAAYALCFDWISPDRVDAFVTGVEVDRSNGWSYTDALTLLLRSCRDDCLYAGCNPDCGNCTAAIVDAVYGKQAGPQTPDPFGDAYVTCALMLFSPADFDLWVLLTEQDRLAGITYDNEINRIVDICNNQCVDFAPCNVAACGFCRTSIASAVYER